MRLVFLIQTEFDIFIHIEGEGAHLVAAVERYLCNYSFVYCAGEHVATVIVGVLTYEIDTTCGSEEFTLVAEKSLEFFGNSGFHTGVILIYGLFSS